MNEMKFIELKKALKDTVEEMVRVLYELRKEKEFNESLRFRAINIYAKFKSLYVEIKSETSGGKMLYINVDYAWETWGLELRKYV